LKVYPNPGSSVLNIENSAEPITLLNLSDIQGRIILTETPGSNTVKADISHLPVGIYILRVQYNNGNTSTIKVIKN
jgi:hypothetical protein